MAKANTENVLIHAPYGKDSTIFADVLSRAGIKSEVFPSVPDLCRALSDGAGAVIVADEALSPSNTEELSRVLHSQEPWSDLPVIVLTGSGESTHLSRYRARLREPLGNVGLLERPLRTETAISAVEAVLRARRRQYEIRDLLKSLEGANAELQTSNRELEEFAYAASHDLREPLRMINVYTELLTERLGDQKDEDIQRFAEVVHDSVERMELLLHDLLRFAHAVHDEDRADQVASLQEALADSIAVLQSRIDDSGAMITCGDLPYAKGDQAQFSQLFTNLISNALKYRKCGEQPKIDVTATRQGDEWVVEVKDEGIGFDQTHAERIFGLFKRLHRDAYPGTGVGLAICKRIVERQGGRIWARSRVGHGASFYFTVPHWRTAA